MKRIGILANEFFHERFGGYGGYGNAARLAASAMAERGDWSPMFLMGQGTPPELGERADIDGVEILLRPRGQSRLKYFTRLLAARLDAILCIDFRPNYQAQLRALPWTPSVIWVHDPRTHDDVARVSQLRLPDGRDAAGVTPIDCTGLAGVVRYRASLRGKTHFGLNATYFEQKLLDTYAVSPASTHFLPTPMLASSPPPAPANPRSERPSVLYLGRIDPIKRPWIFVETARLLPDIDFKMTGHKHFVGEGAWEPGDLPENLSFIGHVEGQEKESALSSSWLLMNPSIHEALPLSFLEALSHGTPIVSCQNPDDITSRFGRVVPNALGHGLGLAPLFAAAISELLRSGDLSSLGNAGKEWVFSHYTRESFVSSLGAILGQP